MTDVIRRSPLRLTAVAATIVTLLSGCATFSDADVVARVGGDEFCAMLSGIGESDVHRPLDRLAALVAERNAGPEAVAPLHYSVGFVTDPMTVPASMPELMAEADRGMYEQKKKRKRRR